MTSQKGRTPDEKVLFALYQIGLEKGDFHTSVSLKRLAQASLQKETALKNIVKHLAQANFVLKEGDDALSLTERGLSFVRTQLL